MSTPRKTQDEVETVKPVKANTTELAYCELRRRIIESELTPGLYLLEQKLGLMLGFSCTPIREAAIRLQGEGLVQIVPRHGIRIVPTSISDIRHIYQVLISLESMAAGLVAARDDVDRAPLDRACDNMSAALERGDMLTWAADDEVFHETLVELSDNARLARVVMNCRDQVLACGALRRWSSRIRNRSSRSRSTAPSSRQCVVAMQRKSSTCIAHIASVVGATRPTCCSNTAFSKRDFSVTQVHTRVSTPFKNLESGAPGAAARP